MQHPTDMLSVLTALPLFAGCPPDVLAKVLLPDCRMATYEAGESIRQYDDPPVLCILTAGSASVHTPGEGSECLLRVLHAGDVFGVATLFAASPAVTRVTAEQPTRVLIVSEAAVRALLTGTPAFALNYVAFLSDRIRFLNRRLACLGAGSAARRLAAWLDASTVRQSMSCHCRSAVCPTRSAFRVPPCTGHWTSWKPPGTLPAPAGTFPCPTGSGCAAPSDYRKNPPPAF